MTNSSPSPVGQTLIKNPEVLLASSVIGILVIMLVPMPRIALDMLLTFNITLAMLVLLVGMQVRRPLDFSVFPTVLLIVTLFRLALNIASTRLILLHGNEGIGAAGEVIRAFGNFVVGGNYTVGLVVFTILVVINFVVVTKGAGRIAEVAARFTLDAMPGKQMSIDADLNAGLINENEARRRRREIAQEAEFYGAMDGASKFVRGDAVAAVIIILVNIVGGLTIGVLQQGQSIATAAQNYTLLTVGEGLVAQIPALIVSVAAGIVVTRAASDANLGQEIANQILVSPRAMATAAGLLLFLGLIPGLPHLAFLTLGSIVGWMAWTLREEERRNHAAEREAKQLPEKPLELPPPVSVIDLIEVQVGFGLIGLVDAARGGELLERIKGIRKQIGSELGFVVPPVHVRDNLTLKPNEYAIVLKGVEITRYDMVPGYVLAIDSGHANKDAVQGVPTKEPAFGLPAIWVSESQREAAQRAGFTVIDSASAIATHLSEVIKAHAYELVGRQETQGLLNDLGKSFPKLIEDLIPTQVTLGVVVRILGTLLRERVPIRDLRSILEAIGDHIGTQKDVEILSEHARQAVSRAITRQYTAYDGTLPIINIDPMLDRALSEHIAVTPQGAQWQVDPGVSQQILTALREAAERVLQQGYSPTIVCSAPLRRHLRRLTERMMPSIPVLAVQELDPSVKVRALETVRGAATPAAALLT